VQIVIVLVLNNQKYVVTFDVQNGKPKFEQLVKRGNKVYEPSDPKNEGYGGMKEMNFMTLLK
jgi:hypothetical protein